MVEEQARAIIKQAQADGVYKGSEPEDGQYAIAEADRLEEMAKIAWANNQRGGEVERILRLAAEWQQENEIDEAAKHITLPDDVEIMKQSTWDEAKRYKPQQSPNRGADEEFAPVATENGGDFSSEPWEDYDELKIGELKALIPNITEEVSLDYVKEYEERNKDRQRVYEYVEKRRTELHEEHEESQENTEGTPSSEGPEENSASHEEATGGEGGSEGSETDRRQTSPRQDGEPDAESQPVGEADESEPEDQGFSPSEAFSEDEDRAEYESLIADVEDEIRRQRLHTPGELPEGEAPELPFDLTTLSDKELQALYSAFNAYAYRVTYLLMVEDAKMRRCRDAAEEIYKYLLSTWPKYDEQNKEKRVATIDAEIEQDQNVRKWRRRQRIHDTYANAYRQERDSYVKVVDTLSRLETMRNNEFERSGNRRR